MLTLCRFAMDQHVPLEFLLEYFTFNLKHRFKDLEQKLVIGLDQIFSNLLLAGQRVYSSLKQNYIERIIIRKRHLGFRAEFNLRTK